MAFLPESGRVKNVDIKDKTFPWSIVKDRGQIGITGELPIDVLVQENMTRAYDSPEKPTEAGYDIVDSTNAKPLIFTITISTNAWNFRDVRRQIEKYADNKDRIMYYSPIDKTIYEDMVITELTIAANVSQWTGFTARLKLKQIRIVLAEDAQFDVKKSTATGQKPQTVPGGLSSGNPGEDNMNGKMFDMNGIFYNWTHRNRGG